MRKTCGAVLFFVSVAAAAQPVPPPATPPWCDSYTPRPLTYPLPAPQQLRLVVIGDAGEAWAASQCGKPVCPPPPYPPKRLAEAIARATADRKADAILVVGDNVYPCGVTDTDVDEAMKTVYGPVFALGVPMYAILGNHDYSEGGTKCGPKDHAAVRPLKQIAYTGGTWHMPARNYVLHWDGLATVVLYDSEPVRRACGARNEIIRFVQSAVTTFPAGEWRIAAAHHSLYSSGEHGQDPNDAGTMRAALLSTFDKRLDLYLSGHDHDLERFGTKTNPVYIVTGSASEKRDSSVKPRPKTFYYTYGFAVIDLTKKTGMVRLYDGDRMDWLGTPLTITH